MLGQLGLEELRRLRGRIPDDRDALLRQAFASTDGFTTSTSGTVPRMVIGVMSLIESKGIFL